MPSIQYDLLNFKSCWMISKYLKPALDLQLLEMLMNNIGEKIHEQVIESRILPILVKIVKKKVWTISGTYAIAWSLADTEPMFLADWFSC